MFKNNGVLFENDLLQIGVKSEFRQNLGRLGLFYGNKTQIALEVCEIGLFLAFLCIFDLLFLPIEFPTNFVMVT